MAVRSWRVELAKLRVSSPTVTRAVLISPSHSAFLISLNAVAAVCGPYVCYLSDHSDSLAHGIFSFSFSLVSDEDQR